MALVRIPEENRTVEGETSIAAYLAERGIDFERWTDAPEAGPGVTGDGVLALYSEKISGSDGIADALISSLTLRTERHTI